MKSTIITEAMDNDHRNLVKLLGDFEKSLVKDKKSIMRAFNEFVWGFEKHLFTEEKAIFITYEPEDEKEGYAFVPRLMNDHNRLIDRIKRIKKNLKNNKDFDYEGFKELLIEHKNFEDESVYPLFDNELGESEKEIIVKRINEIHLIT
jgi:hemerythrin